MFLGKSIENISNCGLFSKGKLGFAIENGFLYVLYNNNGLKIVQRIQIDRRNYHGIRMFIRNYLIDLYYNYEWDGGNMNLDKLGILLGTTTMGAQKNISRIMNKIKGLSYLLK